MTILIFLRKDNFKMNYTFKIYEYFDDRDGLTKNSPVIFIENQEKYGDYFLTEISNLRFDYLEEIVAFLQKVLNGELEQYDFGYEVYSIDCRKDVAQVIDTYNEWKSIAVIPTQEIYEMIRDWKNYLFDYSSSLKMNTDKKIFEEITFNYTFFDGLKSYQVTNQYDNWLSSTDYSVWSNSYVEVGNKRINIIKENVKTLSTFSHFNKEKLELLAKKYELEIKEEKGVYYAYSPNHNSRELMLSENNDLIVIYSIDGDRGPESIFIYGVFENNIDG
jgi:hypothetical protein